LLLSFFIKSRMFLLVSEIWYFVKHIFIHKSYSINYFWWAKFVLNYNREAMWRLCNTIFAIWRINILLQIMYDIIFFISIRWRSLSFVYQDKQSLTKFMIEQNKNSVCIIKMLWISQCYGYLENVYWEV